MSFKNGLLLFVINSPAFQIASSVATKWSDGAIQTATTKSPSWFAFGPRSSLTMAEANRFVNEFKKW